MSDTATPPEDDLDFSTLEPKQKSVTGPDKLKYMLITASVDATLKYRSAAAKAGKFETVKDETTGKDRIKVTGFDNLGEQEFVLVSNTLALTEGDKGERLLLDRQGNPVLISAVKLRGWHGEAISRLYKAALALSPWLQRGDDEEKERTLPKNLSGNGEDSSNSLTV